MFASPKIKKDMIKVKVLLVRFERKNTIVECLDYQITQLKEAEGRW